MSANVTGAKLTMIINIMSNCFNSTEERFGYTFAYCVLSVVSLAGNTFIAIIVYRTKTLRTPINIFIANMAMSDLLFPIFSFTKSLTEVNTAGHWLIDGPLGQALCKFSAFATDVSTLVSIQSLVLIAVDRFVAVVFPLRFPLISSKQCRFFILVIWIVAMVVYCPHLFALKLVEHSEGLVCQWQWKEAFGESLSVKDYLLGLVIVVTYVPLVATAILYFAIALRIKSQKIPGEQSANARKHRLKRERNVLRMSVAVVLVFAVCWLPFSILILFFLLDGVVTISCNFAIAFFLAHSYCAVNPCICFIFSGNYRQGLKKLLSCFSTDEVA